MRMQLKERTAVWPMRHRALAIMTLGALLLWGAKRGRTPITVSLPLTRPRTRHQRFLSLLYNGVTKVYFYCTQDKLMSGQYSIDTIHCYSSTHFHWKDEGVALDEQHCASWVHIGGHGCYGRRRSSI